MQVIKLKNVKIVLLICWIVLKLIWLTVEVGYMIKPVICQIYINVYRLDKRTRSVSFFTFRTQRIHYYSLSLVETHFVEHWSKFVKFFIY